MKVVSLVVPVYRKESIIADCINLQIRQLTRVCKKYDLDFELIAVVDGILDKSGEVIRNLKHPNVKLIEYKHNRGKGFAIRLGMMQAKGDYIGFMDAGLDIDPLIIDHLVEQITKQSAHIVVGSKKHPESKLIYPFKRRLFTTGYALFVKAFTRIKYDDTQVGAKMFTKELIDKVLPRILVKRFAFDVEILSVAQHLGYREHIDVPVNIDFEVDISSATNYKQIMFMAWDTVAVGYRLYIRKHYNDKNQHMWENSLYDLLSKDSIRTY